MKKYIIATVMILCFVIGLYAQTLTYNWHIIGYNRVNELRNIVTYDDGLGHVIMCNETREGGHDSIAHSTSCVQVMSSGAFNSKIGY